MLPDIPFSDKMISSILVEIFMLFIYAENFSIFFIKIPFLQESVHEHGQDGYWIKRIAVSNFDPL